MHRINTSCSDIAACQLAIPFMNECHEDGILIGGDEIVSFRVDWTTTADDDVYMEFGVVICKR